MQVINSYIVISKKLFEIVILHNNLSITDMPPIQHSIIEASNEEEIVIYRKQIKTNIIDAIFTELDDIVESYNILSKENLLNATIPNDLDWDEINSFTKNRNQSDESFSE